MNESGLLGVGLGVGVGVGVGVGCFEGVACGLGGEEFLLWLCVLLCFFVIASAELP